MESSILSRIFGKKCDEKDSFEVPSPIQVKEDIDMRLSERTSLNRLCDIRDWEVGGILSQIMSSLNEGSYIHRKSWEYAMCIYGLESLGVVTPESHAIAVGAGYERPLFYFANRINRMVATDLYSNPGLEGDPSMLTSPEKFAPFPYQRDHLEVLRMDGTDLKFDDNSFDFAFSLSSIEHFGSRSNVEKAMSEIFRVLKPNGILCLATELILNNAHHPEYFTFDELKKHIIESTGLKLVGGDIDFRISKSLYLNPIDLDVEKCLDISPHIVLKKGDVIWTSIVLFFKKEPVTNTSHQFEHLKRMKMDSMANQEYYQRLMAIRYPIYLNLIKTYKHQGKLLDVGCGFSEVLFRDYILPAGFKYYCTDVSEEVVNYMAALTRVQGEDRYAATGILESLPWGNDSFDVVYACHILEHTTNINKAFSEIKRVLKSDGILLFGVPCGYDDEPAHLHNRELDEWLEDFQNNQWQILEWGQFDFNNDEFYGVARPINNNCPDLMSN